MPKTKQRKGKKALYPSPSLFLPGDTPTERLRKGKSVLVEPGTKDWDEEAAIRKALGREDKPWRQIATLIETGPFKVADDWAMAALSGFGRDFSYETADEIAGILDGVTGGSYKKRRDSTRRLLEEIQTEFPAPEMAGRVASMLIGSVPKYLGKKILPAVIGKYGWKGGAKFLEKVGDMIKNNPNLSTTFREMVEHATYVGGAADEAENIGRDYVTDVGTYTTPSIGFGLKGIQKGKQLWQSAPQYRKIAAGKVFSVLSGLNPETMKWLKENYQQFFNKKDLSPEETLQKLQTYILDFDSDITEVTSRALGKLNRALPSNLLSKTELVDNINEMILSRFRKKGLGKFKIHPGMPDIDPDVNLLSDMDYKTLEALLKPEKLPITDKGHLSLVKPHLGGKVELADKQMHKIEKVYRPGVTVFENNKILKEFQDNDVLKELFKLRDEIIKKERNIFSEIEVKNIMMEKINPHTSWGTKLQNMYGANATPESRDHSITFQRLYGKINGMLKKGNPAYKAEIEAVEDAIKSLRGDPQKGVPGLLDVLEIDLYPGKVMFRSKDEMAGANKTYNKLGEALFSKAQLGRNNSQKVLKKALVSAHRLRRISKRPQKTRGNIIEKREDFLERRKGKSERDNFLNFAKDLKASITQERFKDADTANDFIEKINKRVGQDLIREEPKGFMKKLGGAAGKARAVFEAGTGPILLLDMFSDLEPGLVKLAYPFFIASLYLRGKKITFADAILEAEKAKKALKNNPVKALEKMGAPSKWVREKAAEISRGVPEAIERDYKPEKIKTEETLDTKEDEDEEPLGFQEINQGAPPQETAEIPQPELQKPIEAPAPLGKIGIPVEEEESVTVEALEEVPELNPEEDQRDKRKETIRKFLAQQGSKKAKKGKSMYS